MLSDNQIGCISGMLFGDACIPSRTHNTLKVWHSTKQEDYVKFKHKFLAEFFGKSNEIKYQSNLHYTGKTYSTCGFQISDPLIGQFYDWFYIDNQKTYLQENLDRLTPQGLALWYMDDGSCDSKTNVNGVVRSCQTYLHTYTTLEQATLIQDYLLGRFGVEAKIKNFFIKKTNRMTHCIRMNTENSIKFVELIQPFVIESMSYKLKHVFDVKNGIKKTAIGNCANCGKEKETSGLLCRKCQVAQSNKRQYQKPPRGGL